MADPYEDLDDSKGASAKLDDEDVKWLMSSPRGRRVMFLLLSATHQEAPTFSPDPYVAAFQEGKRFVGLTLLANIRRLCPEHELTMRMEQNL